MTDVVEIPLSKKKIIFSFLGAIMFILLGLLLIVKAESFETMSRYNAETIVAVGIVSVLFFGICLIYIAKKLFDKKVGLRIDQNGITDNSNATSVGLVDWQDIVEIKSIQVASTKILLVMTNKPKKYIDRAKNIIAKQAMKANQKMYGSPLSIISNSLQINFDDLKKLLVKEFRKRKQ